MIQSVNANVICVYVPFLGRPELSELADHGDAALDVGEVEADHVVEVKLLAVDDDDGAGHLLVEPETVPPRRRPRRRIGRTHSCTSPRLQGYKFMH